MNVLEDRGVLSSKFSPGNYLCCGLIFFFILLGVIVQSCLFSEINLYKDSISCFSISHDRIESIGIHIVCIISTWY